MKKFLVVTILSVVVVSSFLLPASAASEGELIGYLSNRGMSDPFSWRVIGLDYQNPTELYLAPNSVFIIQGVLFTTDAYGRIPDGVSISAFGDDLWVVWDYSTSVPNRYAIATDSIGQDWFYRPNSTIGIYAYGGSATDYQTGYSAGYNDGYERGESDGYAQGESVGYQNGYQEAEERYEGEYERGRLAGYREGLETAENGDWKALFSAVVDAPIQTLQGMFNFEILGFDMRLAIGGVLTLCVTLIVVKLFLAKG